MATRIKYTGSTPGADSNTYKLYDTTDNGLTDLFSHCGISKYVLQLSHSHGGTLKWYKSMDAGATWDQIGQESIPAPASANEITSRDILVEGFLDFKAEWENGGTAQDPWNVSQALSKERSSAA